MSKEFKDINGNILTIEQEDIFFNHRLLIKIGRKKFTMVHYLDVVEIIEELFKLCPDSEIKIMNKLREKYFSDYEKCTNELIQLKNKNNELLFNESRFVIIRDRACKLEKEIEDLKYENEILTYNMNDRCNTMSYLEQQLKEKDKTISSLMTEVNHQKNTKNK